MKELKFCDNRITAAVHVHWLAREMPRVPIVVTIIKHIDMMITRFEFSFVYRSA